MVFSDHHKGIGDPADDFRRCEHAYTTALGYYLVAGYKLFVLGDAEELWEEHAGDVIKRYRDVLELEARVRRARERRWPASTGTTTTSGSHRSRSRSTCAGCSVTSRSARRCV